MQERPTEYGICIHTHHTIYIYIYKWSFLYVCNDLKSFNFFTIFSKVISSNLAKQPHDY